jgi:hypothetical protein
MLTKQTLATRLQRPLSGIQRRARTATILLSNPQHMGGYLRCRVTGRYPAARYFHLWQEVQRLRPRRIVEIGVFRGETGARLIEHALLYQDRVDYWGFDLFAEGATSALLEAEAAIVTPPLALESVYQRLQHPRATVHLIPGDTKITLPRTDMPPADLVFIDGGHSYETVTADWLNVQRILHERTVVYFDDYTNAAAEIHEHYGVKRLLDGLRRSQWRVEILEPADTYIVSYGIKECRLGRVTRKSA